MSPSPPSKTCPAPSASPGWPTSNSAPTPREAHRQIARHLNAIRRLLIHTRAPPIARRHHQNLTQTLATHATQQVPTVPPDQWDFFFWEE